MFELYYIRKPDYPKLARLDYDEYWKTRGFEIKGSLRDREKNILSNIPAGSRVLDIGCGNSRLPVALKEKGCQVTVGDVSPKVLEGFKSYGLSALTLDLTDITQTQGQLERYDYIVLSEVIEHLPNPEEVILSLANHTDHFIISIPNSAYFWFRVGLLFRGRFFTQWVHHPSEHLRFWSHIDFMDWLKAMDLKLIKATASRGFKFLKDVWPNMFGFQMVYVVKAR